MTAAAHKDRIVRLLEDGRRETFRLLDPLNDDELSRQYDPIMSPLVWDLGHVGNYEELWLLRALGDSSFADPRLDLIYDAFENPRWTRSELPLLERGEALTYLADVRAAVVRGLKASELDPEVPLLAGGFVYSLVEQHEAQHQETILQALDLRREAQPYGPAASRRGFGDAGAARQATDTARVFVPAGPFDMGSDDAGATYDNERPGHRVDIGAFWLDRFPVTCRRFAAFIADGGYARPELWSERGWGWRTDTGHESPQGWLPSACDGWLVRRFHHVAPLDPAEPVEHVSFFEAEAFASWAGGRLPTEAEWEKAAVWDPGAQRARRYPWGDSPPGPRHANLDRRAWGPAPVGSYPAGASAFGVEQLVGDVYEWTVSGFEAYPGFSVFPYAEYSEVFFGGDYRVLRGSSWASRQAVARPTFRNWDHPYRRQLFAGLRLAYNDGIAA